jgi:hypothetical protein
MQLPLFLLRRGQPGRNPRGLFDLFDSDSEEEDASPGDGRSGNPPAAVPDDEFRDPTLNYLGRQLSLFGRHILTNPMTLQLPTWDAASGELKVVPYLKSMGDRYSDTASKLPVPGGVMPPGPRATGPVTTLSRPGFLFGPGAGAISWPQAEDSRTIIYRLPPEEVSKEDCDEQEREELARCHNDWGAIFGYDHWSYHGCKQRTKDRAILCRKGIADGPLPWSNSDVDGIVWPKPPRSLK